MKLTQIAVRNIKRNKKRSVLSVTATAIATFAIVFMFSFIGGFRKDIMDIAFNYVSGEIQVRHREFDTKSFSLERAVDNYEEVVEYLKIQLPDAELSPRLKFPSTVFEGDKSYICFGVAVDWESEESFLGLKDKIIEGVMPAHPREVIMGHGLAEELKLEVGDKFTPITTTRRGASAGITFKVAALAKFSDAGYSNKTFIVSLEQLPAMLKMKGSVTDILIKGIGDENLDATVEQLNALFLRNGHQELEALSWKQGDTYEWIQMADFAYTIIAAFFFFLASTVIANTMLMVVFERRKEIGTITAMGMTGSEVVRLFFLEAFFLGLIGAGSGVVSGSLLVIPLSIFGLDMTSMMGSVEMASSFYIFPQLSLKSTMFVFIYSTAIASLVSYFPSRSASKVDPVVALRSE